MDAAPEACGGLSVDNIYVLMTGEYSDRSNVGFVETEEEAKKICDFKNSVKGIYGDEWHYEEIEQYKIDFQNVKLKYRYTFRFHQDKNRTWLMDGKYICEKIETTGGDIIDNIVTIYSKNKKRSYLAEVRFILGDENLEIAKKIAQDKLYERLAMEELEYRYVPPRYIYTFLFEWKEYEPDFRLRKSPEMEVSDSDSIRVNSPDWVNSFQIRHVEDGYQIKMRVVRENEDESAATKEAMDKLGDFVARGRRAGLIMFGATQNLDN